MFRHSLCLNAERVVIYTAIIGCRADPLADITELTRVAFVMKGGRVYRNEQP